MFLQDTLSAYTETISILDGFYFQSLMEKLIEMDATALEEFVAPFNEFRIYAA